MFQRKKAFFVSDEAFSGRVNSKENRVVIGCIFKCIHRILLSVKVEQVTEIKSEGSGVLVLSTYLTGVPKTRT